MPRSGRCRTVVPRTSPCHSFLHDEGPVFLFAGIFVWVNSVFCPRVLIFCHLTRLHFQLYRARRLPVTGRQSLGSRQDQTVSPTFRYIYQSGGGRGLSVLTSFSPLPYSTVLSANGTEQNSHRAHQCRRQSQARGEKNEAGSVGGDGRDERERDCSLALLPCRRAGSASQ